MRLDEGSAVIDSTRLKIEYITHSMEQRKDSDR